MDFLGLRASEAGNDAPSAGGKIDSAKCRRALLSSERARRLFLMSKGQLPLLEFQPAKRLGLVPGGERPVRFPQQFVRFDGADDRVNYPAAWGAEIAGDVSPLLHNVAVDVGRGKIADLLMSGHKILRKQLADARVRQGARPVCAGVVSREPRHFEVAGDVNQEDQLLAVFRLLGRFLNRFRPGERGAELAVLEFLGRRADLRGGRGFNRRNFALQRHEG